MPPSVLKRDVVDVAVVPFELRAPAPASPASAARPRRADATANSFGRRRIRERVHRRLRRDLRPHIRHASPAPAPPRPASPPRRSTPGQRDLRVAELLPLLRRRHERLLPCSIKLHEQGSPACPARSPARGRRLSAATRGSPAPARPRLPSRRGKPGSASRRWRGPARTPAFPSAAASATAHTITTNAKQDDSTDDRSLFYLWHGRLARAFSKTRASARATKRQISG